MRLKCSDTTDSQKPLFKMCFELPSSPKSCTVPQPGRSGLCFDRERLDAFLRCSKRNEYCANDVRLITDLFCWSCSRLGLLDNEQHVLHPLLPEKWISVTIYVNATTTEKIHAPYTSFIVSMLFKDSYWRFRLSTFFYLYINSLRYVNVLYTRIGLYTSIYQ